MISSILEILSKILEFFLPDRESEAVKEAYIEKMKRVAEKQSIDALKEYHKTKERVQSIERESATLSQSEQRSVNEEVQELKNDLHEKKKVRIEL